jgi:hypothetical protein
MSASSRPSRHTSVKAQIGNITNPAELRVVLAMLCKPDLLNATCREIAAAARVAMRTVGSMIKELETRGHITRLPEVGRNRSAAVVKGSGRLARIVFAENVFAAEHVPAVNELCHLAVNGCMADRAERDQVLVGVVARLLDPILLIVLRTGLLSSLAPSSPNQRLP